MMKRMIFTLQMMLFCLTIGAQKAIDDDRRLREGDLLFVVNAAGNAITDVTEGIDALPIDHVGIYHRHGKEGMVLEATYDGVVDTPFSRFLKPGTTILVGRVNKVDAPKTLANAHRFLGAPYDFIYLAGNDAIYCSELVQESYVLRGGKAVFSPIPMSFHDSSGHITPYWEDFYSRRGLAVPEGQPGSNPGALSRHPQVKIKYVLRSLEGSF